MTPIEFQAAREELLAGFATPKYSTKIFGLLLGYEANSAGRIIKGKERGDPGRNITRTDELIIAYLREIKARDGHILAAAQHVPEPNEEA